jgi:FMN phosphatase YigB (HAD superfamily)
VLRAALIDVGGTLWPERGPWIQRQCRRLQRLFPRSDEKYVSQLVRALNEQTFGWENSTVLEQDTDLLIEQVLRQNGAKDVSVLAVREAMCVPASEGADLFHGAVELLKTTHELELRTVLVSNTAWRDAEGYRCDFEYFGVSEYIDGIVTSLDLKFRKPHEAVFGAALQIAGCSAEECVFVGDSEKKDIVPASQHGMRTVLVAIEGSPPTRTAADVIATSLEEVTEILKKWMTR